MSSSASAVFPLSFDMSRSAGLGKQPNDSYPTVKSGKAANPMNEFNQAPDRSSDDSDDLEQIKGIGPTIAQALNNLGICRYADLADFTPDRLAELLKSEIPSISSQRIESSNWLGQARALAQDQAEPASPQPETPATNDTSASSADAAQVSPSVDSPEQNEAKTPRDSWRELADFFVSFGYSVNHAGVEQLQTKVHYSQADRFGQWDGIVTDRLINWMLNQANLASLIDVKTQVESAAPAEQLPPTPISDEETLLELFFDLSDLWVSEVKVTTPAMGRYGSTMLRAECRLNLSGPAAIELTNDRLSYVVELYLVDTQTNQSKLTASYPGQLMPTELVYEIQQDFPVPPVGRYQLYLVARLLPPGTAVTHLQGPIIRAEET